LDTFVLDDKSNVLDPQQRSFQAMWWIIRNFSETGVISLWDGVGTVSTAAIFAGRDVVALEPNKVRYSHACARMSQLVRREDLIMQHAAGDKSAGVFCLFAAPTCFPLRN
jgi:hypothetical protein